MALSNYEKQKRWREKNRGLYNFQQRERRKKLSGGEKSLDESGGIKTLEKTEIDLKFESSHPSSIRDSGQLSTVEQLRELERKERERVVDAPVASPAKFGTYRDDGGRPITERAWNELQKKKERAEKGGYVYDEFSQA